MNPQKIPAAILTARLFFWPDRAKLRAVNPSRARARAQPVETRIEDLLSRRPPEK
jgi:hypothetical protein